MSSNKTELQKVASSLQKKVNNYKKKVEELYVALRKRKKQATLDHNTIEKLRGPQNIACPQCNCDTWKGNGFGQYVEGKRFCWECQEYVFPVRSGMLWRQRRKNG